jgi:hypothetical protein
VRRRTLLPPAVADQPFLVRDALALGISRDVLRGASFRRPFQGVRVPAHLPETLEVRCRAAALLVPRDAAFSHATATALLGLPLPRDETTAQSSGVLESAHGSWLPTRTAAHDARVPLHVTVPVRDPRVVGPRLVGIVTHVSKLEPQETQLRADGLRTTTPTRTWLDRAATLDLVELVALADAILRRGLVTDEELQQAVHGWSGRPGAALSRRAATLVEPATDSSMETRLRLLLVLAGLPRPVANRDVVAHGGWIARPDLSYPELKIAIEYDGDHHRVSRRQWQNDIGRRRVLEEEGWLVLVFTADDVLRRGDDTVRRVRSALAQGRAA